MNLSGATGTEVYLFQLLSNKAFKLSFEESINRRHSSTSCCWLRFSWQSTLLQHNKLTFWGEKKYFWPFRTKVSQCFFSRRFHPVNLGAKSSKYFFFDKFNSKTNFSDLLYILSEVLLWNKMVQTANLNHNYLKSVYNVAFCHYISHHFHFHHLYHVSVELLSANLHLWLVVNLNIVPYV